MSEVIDMYCVPLDALPEVAHPTHSNSPEAIHMLRVMEQEASVLWYSNTVVPKKIENLMRMSRDYEEFLELYIEDQCRL